MTLLSSLGGLQSLHLEHAQSYRFHQDAADLFKLDMRGSKLRTIVTGVKGGKGGGGREHW